MVRKIKAVGILLSVGTILSLPMSVSGSEFGNIFGGKAADQSRVASAQALDGIAAIISAIKARELQQSSGEEEFQSAINLLFESAVQMRKVISGEFGEISVQQLSNDEQAIVASYLDTQIYIGENRSPTNIIELYRTFIDYTDSFAIFLKSIDPSDMTPMFPRISSELAKYVAYGGLVTEITHRHQAN